MTWMRAAHYLVDIVLIGVLVILLSARGNSPISVSSRAMLANVEDAMWAPDEPILGGEPFFDEPPADEPPQVPSDGDFVDPYGFGRTPESQAYIDENGERYAPCMDTDTCDYGSGSMKDGVSAPADSGSSGKKASSESFAVRAPSSDDYTYTRSSGRSDIYFVDEIFPVAYYGETYRYIPVSGSSNYTTQYTVYGPMQPGVYVTPHSVSATMGTSDTVSYSAGTGLQAPTQVQARVQQQTVVSAPATVSVAQYQTPAQPYSNPTGGYVSVPMHTAQATYYANQGIEREATAAPGYDTPIPVSETVSPSCTIDVSPSAPVIGATTTISWKSKHATWAALAPGGSVALSGHKDVRISTTTTYTLAVTAGSASSSCSITIVPDTSMCPATCPRGYICTPAVATAVVSSASTSPAKQPAKTGFWSWLGL